MTANTDSPTENWSAEKRRANLLKTATALGIQFNPDHENCKRSEYVAYCWNLQRIGFHYPDIAVLAYKFMPEYAPGHARKIVEVEKCKTDSERNKVLTVWLKGSLDIVVLTCGKLGSRVKKALLLHEMSLDMISPAIGQGRLEKAEFEPKQERCRELFKCQKADPLWTPEGGSQTFNDLIARYAR